MPNSWSTSCVFPYRSLTWNACAASENAEAASAEGVAIAQRWSQRVRPLVAGVQLSGLFERYQTAIDVAHAINQAIER